MFEGWSRNCAAIWLTAASALLSASCVTAVADEEGEELLEAYNAELKNGTPFDGSGVSRGVVGIRYWSPGWKEWRVCSGQVVSKRTIMTAAHCVVQASAVPGQSGISGTARIIVWRPLANSSQAVVLSETTVTARYNPSYDQHIGAAVYDVGLFIAPFDLPTITVGDAGFLAKTTPSNVTMYALGFGLHDDGPQFDDLIGRSGAIVPTYASKTLEYFFEATATQPQICKQDSGGPLKSETSGLLQVYGVASRHDGPGTYCKPIGRWATTAHNMNWLRGRISGSCSETSTNYYCW